MPGRSAALSEIELPPLPLEEWEDTKETLHRYCQIVGKTRMELSPFRNHWWHVTLYVSPRGLTTGPIPFAAGAFEATLDLLESRCKTRISKRLSLLRVAEWCTVLCSRSCQSGVNNIRGCDHRRWATAPPR